MESRETDSYGEWLIRKLQQQAGEDGHPLPAEVLAAARAIMPTLKTCGANTHALANQVEQAEAKYSKRK